MSDRAGRVELPAPALAGATTTLLLMGMLAAAYGPLLPYFMSRFAISVPVAGLVFGVHFAGALLGVIGGMLSMSRVTGRMLVTVALTSLTLGCLGIALAPSWPLTLTAVFFVGFGFGQLDLGINQLIAYSISPARVALLNGLNGVYGLGAVAAPLAIAAAAGRYAGLYVGAAGLALVGLAGLRMVRGRLTAEGAEPAVVQARLITLFALAFALYVGLETGVAGWMPTHLLAMGYSRAAAAAVTSGFWFALALGRFLAAPLSLRVGDGAIVVGATSLAIVTLLLTLNAAVAPLGYLLTGLAIAPIFPTGVAWLARLNPANPTATSWLFPASMMGGAIIPTLAGLFIARIGAGSVPVLFAVVASSSLAAFASAAPSPLWGGLGRGRNSPT